jgi:hypothetical protein
MTNPVIRSYADFQLTGSLIFGKNHASFPASPRDGQTCLKDGVLWVFTTLAGLQTWYPLTNKKNSYVHTQAVDSFQWNVSHALNSPNVVVGVFGSDGLIMYPSVTVVDANTVRLNFTSAVSGRAVVFADGELFSPAVQTSNVVTNAITIGGRITGGTDGLFIDGKAVATVDQIVANTGAALNGSQTNNFSTKNLTVAGDLLPAANGVYNIGSPTMKWASVYTKEMHIDANTLYVDGVAVLGSSANTIQVTADVNQGLRLSTTGTGQTIMDSQAATLIQTNGTNADVQIQARGQGSLVRLTSGVEVTLTAPTIRATGALAVTGAASVGGDLTITGKLVVQGTQTFIDSANVQIQDNIVLLNRGEVSSGVSLRYSGLQIDRGDLADSRIVWDETAGKFLAGVMGSESALATAADVAGKADAATTYTKAQVDAAIASALAAVAPAVLDGGEF